MKKEQIQFAFPHHDQYSTFNIKTKSAKYFLKKTFQNQCYPLSLDVTLPGKFQRAF